MVAAVDIGNTSTVVGAFSEGILVAVRAFPTDPNRTSHEFQSLLEQAFCDLETGTQGFTSVAICSVVPQAVNSVVGAFPGRSIYEIHPSDSFGFPVVYNPPASLGADRFANAYAAWHLYQRACIVVDCGTATKFDVVNETGSFIGGAIAPGLKTQAEGLFRAGAQLREVPLQYPESAIGHSTVQALQSGVMFGHLAMVEGMIVRLRTELGCDPLVVATGGYSATVQNCRLIDKHDLTHTLQGIHLLWEKHQARKRL